MQIKSEDSGIFQHGQWIGSILLNMCSLIERPSKKNGFCFKLFNPSDRYIWASRGPHGEIFGALTVHRLPGSYIICRAASEQVFFCLSFLKNLLVYSVSF